MAFNLTIDEPENASLSLSLPLSQTLWPHFERRSSVGQRVKWLTDWLTDCLTGWLVDWLHSIPFQSIRFVLFRFFDLLQLSMKHFYHLSLPTKNMQNNLESLKCNCETGNSPKKKKKSRKGGRKGLFGLNVNEINYDMELLFFFFFHFFRLPSATRVHLVPAQALHLWNMNSTRSSFTPFPSSPCSAPLLSDFYIDIWLADEQFCHCTCPVC